MACFVLSFLIILFTWNPGVLKFDFLPDFWQLASSVQFSSLTQLCPTLQPHGPQHARPPCPSPTPRVYPNSCPLSQWCHPTISSSVVPFSSCLQSCPASGSIQMSQLFASGGQSIGVSASTSVLPMKTQDRSSLGWTGWISLQSKGLSRVFSNTTVQNHQFFSTHLSGFTFSFHFMHWRRKWKPTPMFLPGKSQGWVSLVGCHLWDCIESDTTKET